jgi:hypothetical protein
VKQALFAALFLLPVAASAQPAPSPELQAAQTEILQQLSAKLLAQTQVIDLKAQVADLQKQLDAAKAAPPAPPKKD